MNDFFKENKPVEECVLSPILYYVFLINYFITALLHTIIIETQNYKLLQAQQPFVYIVGDKLFMERSCCMNSRELPDQLITFRII